MDVEITFLEGAIPLVKSFTLVDGQVEKSNYPMVRNFTSHSYSTKNIEGLFKLFKQHADKGHCMLKGNVVRELQNESRAGSTDPATPTHVIVFDADGVKDQTDTEEFVRDILPPQFHDVSYIAQYSASMGITSERLAAHIIFVSKNPVSPQILKQWFTRLNLDNATLRDSLSLSRTGNTLRYPLDVSVADNSKLIFCANPKIGKGVPNKFKGDRIRLIRKKKAVVDLDWSKFNPGTIRADTTRVLNELRKANNLKPIRSMSERVVGETVVGKVTDQPEITGIKEERGFTYLNLPQFGTIIF